MSRSHGSISPEAETKLAQKRQHAEHLHPRKRMRSQSSTEHEGSSFGSQPYARESAFSMQASNHQNRHRNATSRRQGRMREHRHDFWRPAKEPTDKGISSRTSPVTRSENGAATTSDPQDVTSAGHVTTRQHNKKSKRDRKENPSSKIHSLKKLIERGTLPPQVQVEKERELATLLFEREKKALKNQSKRNLERYHFIRFMERQKATRNLKRLRKEKAAGQTADQQGYTMEDRVHTAEVDLNYTMYAPLGEKYISIFAEQRDGVQISKAEKYKGNWKVVKHADQKFFNQWDIDQLQKDGMEAANVLEIFGNTPEETNLDTTETKTKPPMWYEVEAAMEGGEERLQALRDRVQNKKKSEDLVVGMKAGDKRKLDWLEDDGMVDPADLDSKSDEEMETVDSRSSKKRQQRSRAHNGEDDDDDMSDGDGGFFEKR